MITLVRPTSGQPQSIGHTKVKGQAKDKKRPNKEQAKDKQRTSKGQEKGKQTKDNPGTIQQGQPSRNMGQPTAVHCKDKDLILSRSETQIVSHLDSIVIHRRSGE
jgi:hypothetical protein